MPGWGTSQRQRLLRSVKTEYPNDGLGLPSKSDYCNPSFRSALCSQLALPSLTFVFTSRDKKSDPMIGSIEWCLYSTTTTKIFESLLTIFAGRNEIQPQYLPLAARLRHRALTTCGGTLHALPPEIRTPPQQFSRFLHMLASQH